MERHGKGGLCVACLLWSVGWPRRILAKVSGRIRSHCQGRKSSRQMRIKSRKQTKPSSTNFQTCSSLTVPVRKPNGHFEDEQITLLQCTNNKCIDLEHHPLPTSIKCLLSSQAQNSRNWIYHRPTISFNCFLKAGCSLQLIPLWVVGIHLLCRPNHNMGNTVYGVKNMEANKHGLTSKGFCYGHAFNTTCKKRVCQTTWSTQEIKSTW